MSYASKTKLMRGCIYAVLVILTIICILPMWILLVNATRNTPQIQQGVSLLPSTHAAINWKNLTNRGFSISNGFKNSVIIAVGVTVLSVYFSLMFAYAIHVYDFFYKKFIYGLVVVLVLVPGQVLSLIHI